MRHAHPTQHSKGRFNVATQNPNKPNWFAAGWLGQFMASTAGRLTRLVGGVVLIGAGLLAIGGPVGIIIAAIGLVPLLAGSFDVCVFSALFGGPFSGSAMRALGGR
jgi:hypothetical protein